MEPAEVPGVAERPALNFRSIWCPVLARYSLLPRSSRKRCKKAI